MDAARRALRFVHAVLLRALVSIGGALTAYGATGMFTTAGLMPPNALVIVGLAVCAAAILAMWTSERRMDGIWPAMLLIGLPYSLYSFGSWSIAECLPDHAPITPAFSCSPIGTHAIAVVAPVITLVALVLLVRDVRGFAKR